MNLSEDISLPEQESKEVRRTQFQNVYLVFLERPSTILMASRKTGIERASICRYCATMRKAGTIYLLNKGLCPISKHPAGFLTTNPELIPKDLTL